MSGQGRGQYDVVVDVDAEGDLGHTDLQDDLEFHQSTFDNTSAPKPGQQSSYLAPPPSSASASSKRYLWSIHFYQQFFDLTTTQLLTRLYNTFRPDRNFLDTLDGNPDLYGPVWISTTVVVILFLTGTISQYLAEKGEQHFVYDWRLLSGAAGLVYGFNLVVPAALWGVLKWFAGRGSGLGEDGREVLGLVESWCLYGYASLVWVVVALVSWSPLSALNYAFVGVGFAYSAFFLVRNLYPVVSATDKKTSKILLLVVLGLHAGFAIAIKILFFAHASPVSKKGKPTDGEDAAMLFAL
ncbi:hypothetical protein MBLNU230_g5085t1 [Neophaeotheca triangularis]